MKTYFYILAFLFMLAGIGAGIGALIASNSTGGAIPAMLFLIASVFSFGFVSMALESAEME